jgi:hypothetical protein
MVVGRGLNELIGCRHAVIEPYATGLCNPSVADHGRAQRFCRLRHSLVPICMVSSAVGSRIICQRETCLRSIAKAQPGTDVFLRLKLSYGDHGRDRHLNRFLATGNNRGPNVEIIWKLMGHVQVAS